MKKIIAFAFIITAVFSLSTFTAYADDINILLDNEKLSFSTKPIVLNDRIMVPLRETFEAFGATVTWDENTQSATAVNDGYSVSVTIGSDKIHTNDNVIKMDCQAIELNDRILIPIRYAANAFGCSISWDDISSTAFISSVPSYECYDISPTPVPVYNSVIPSSLYIEENLDVCDEYDYAYATEYSDVTDYIMVLQKYYGYSYYTTKFGENGDVLYVYQNIQNENVVQILCTQTTAYGYTAVITPTLTPAETEQSVAANKNDSNSTRQNENSNTEYYPNTDNTLPTYTYITGIEPYDTEETEKCFIYKYKDEFASAAQYKMAITMFCGYDEYNTEIDFGTITTYYINDDNVIGIVNSVFDDEVWIIIAK